MYTAKMNIEKDRLTLLFETFHIKVLEKQTNKKKSMEKISTKSPPKKKKTKEKAN